MPRRSYYAPVGNSLNIKRLPSRAGTVFEQPLENDGSAIGRLIILLVISGAAMFSIWLAANSPPPQLLMFQVPGVRLAFMGAAICLAWMLCRLAAEEIGIALLASCVMVTLFVWQESVAVFLLSGAAIASLTYYFLLHHVHHQTAAPCDRKLAEWFRSTTQPLPIALKATLAAGAVLYLPFGVNIIALIVVLYAIASRWGAVCMAVASWLSYPDSKAAGVFQSPVAPQRERFGFAIGVIIILAGCIVMHAGRQQLTTIWALALIGGLGEAELMPVVYTLHMAFFLSLPLISLLIAVGLAAVMITPSIQDFRYRAITTDFEYAKAMRDSPNRTEKDSILLGHVAADNTPVLAHRKSLKRAWILGGPSGLNKTTMMGQVMENILLDPEASLFCIDMKGDDYYLINSILAAGRRLKLISTIYGEHSHLFRPFEQRAWIESFEIDRASYLCDSLGLTYGTDYGQGHFTSAIAAVCYQTVRKHPFASIAELQLKVMETIARGGAELPRKLREESGTLAAKLLLLSGVETLNSTEKPTLQVGELFDRPSVWYLRCPALGGGSVNPEIARFALHSVVAESKRRGPRNRRQVNLFIEEFPGLVAKNLERIFEQCRSLDIGLMLSAQGLSNLRSRYTDLAAIIEQNTVVRWWFGAGDIDLIDRLSRGSGETVETLSSYNGVTGETTREFIAPRMNRNEIMQMTDDPHLSALHITRGHGFAQYSGLPIMVRTQYHISEREYERRRTTVPDIITDDMVKLGEKPLPAPTPQPAEIAQQTIERRPSRRYKPPR